MQGLTIVPTLSIQVRRGWSLVRPQAAMSLEASATPFMQ